MGGGTAPPKVGQGAKRAKWTLFRNSTEKVLSGDVIGYGKFNKMGHINKEWFTLYSNTLFYYA